MRPFGHTLGAAVLSALIAGLLGCGRSQEAVEADRVLRAIDVLREAPSAQLEARLALADKLAELPVTSPKAAAARDACVRAYRLLLDGSVLEGRVRDALDGSRAAASAVLADLAEAEAKIKQSAAAMPECERAVAELRRARR